jgi:uncharacterized protein DUF3179
MSRLSGPSAPGTAREQRTERVREDAQIMKHPARRMSLLGTLSVLLFALAAVTISAVAAGQEAREVKVERKPKYISNGAGQKPFDVTRHTVPLAEIERSVPKNSIPALVHPRFVAAGEIGKLLDVKDRVLGVYLNGEAKAYPIRILNWHELVNDEVGGRPILVSW